MLTRLLTLFSVVLVFSMVSIAQQACKVEVPVGVISVTGETFRGLAADDFSGRVQKKPVGLKSLTYDDGPRRIAIVVDVNKKLSTGSRKAEQVLIEAMMAGARPEDTFALLPAHGPGGQVSFTTDRHAITDAAGGSSAGGKDVGTLDAVMTAIELFGAPQSGDAIVVMAADLEGNHKTNAKAVAKALQEHHIRMFGLALGPVATKSVVAGGTATSTATRGGLAWTQTAIGDGIYDTGDENFFPLSINSGGLLLAAMNADPRRSYDIANARLVQELQQKAKAVSRMIDSFYRMEVEPPPLSHPEDWSLDVNDSLKKHTQPMFLLYPRALGPC